MNEESKKPDRWVFSKEEQAMFDEFLASKDVQDIKDEYLAYRRSSGWQARSSKTGIGARLRILALKFVDKLVKKYKESNKDLLKFVNLETVVDRWVDKIARRLRDYFESEANKEAKSSRSAPQPIIAAEAPELPGFGPDTTAEPEKPVAPVEAAPAGVIDVLVIELRSLRETQSALVEAVKGLARSFDDAMFVKPGALVDRKTGLHRHVGWSWLHCLQSELAQIRGLTAPKKEENKGSTADATIPQENKEKEETNG